MVDNFFPLFFFMSKENDPKHAKGSGKMYERGDMYAS